MNFQSYLSNLRQKPEHHKKSFAFWTSFGFVAIVFAFWLASVTSGLTTSNSVVATETQNIESPGSSLIAGVGNFFGDIFGYFIKPKVVEYSNIEVVAGEK